MKATLEEIIAQGPLMYRTRGISMLPLLRENRDLVIIEKADEPAVLDVVLFRRGNGTYVLHRILSGSAETGYIICGDNLVQMELVRREQIIGRMSAFIRDGKKTEVTDRAYLRYVRRLPLRRLWIRVRNPLRSVGHFAKMLVRDPGRAWAKLCARLRRPGA